MRIGVDVGCPFALDLGSQSDCLDAVVVETWATNARTTRKQPKIEHTDTATVTGMRLLSRLRRWRGPHLPLVRKGQFFTPKRYPLIARSAVLLSPSITFASQKDPDNNAGGILLVCRLWCSNGIKGQRGEQGWGRLGRAAAYPSLHERLPLTGWRY